MVAPSSKFDYSREFGSVYHGARKLPPRAEEWISRIRARKLQAWIAPADRVLEFGVGFGWNLAALQCTEKVGFDLTPELRSHVESKGIRFESRIEHLEPNRYQIILAHHVLEHVPDPSATLKLFKTFLQTGKLILFVPFEREKKYHSWNPSNKAHHLFSWTPSSLSRLLSDSGWAIDQIQLQRFRFDRVASVMAIKLRGSFFLYNLLRRIGITLFPEFEISVVARPAPDKG